MLDPASTRLLHFRRMRQKGVKFAGGELLHRAWGRLGDPAHIAHRIEADRRAK
jgi:hypothetical protein